MSAKTKIITLIAILIICLGMIVYGTISEGNSIMDIMPRLILMGLTAVVVIIRIASNSPEKQSLDKEPFNATIDTSRFETKNIEDIWKIESKEEFVHQMWLYVIDNCSEYGDLHNLNENQRTFYIVQDMEVEVNNGGFAQYFFNDSGFYADELVSSFEKIGAMKTAEICKKAISIYGDEVPTNRDEREDVITPDDENEEERIEELLNECDDAFFEYEDDLVELNYQFILNNKESFLN